MSDSHTVPTPSAPSRWRKRPVVIEAMRLSAQSIPDVARWCGGRVITETKASDPTDVRRELLIPTLEGNVTADIGDWVIRGVQGEFYPCKPDTFEATYEPAGGAE